MPYGVIIPILLRIQSKILSAESRDEDKICQRCRLQFRERIFAKVSGSWEFFFHGKIPKKHDAGTRLFEKMWGW